ncbi:MAG: hypothetical protein WCF55_08570, partial [Pseudolabrys sp.]
MKQFQTLSAGPDLRLWGKKPLTPGIRCCSLNRIGAYLLCSESSPSSLIGALMIASYALVSVQVV